MTTNDQSEIEKEDGLDIMELERQPGWQKLKSKIREEQDTALQELRRIELEGRSLEAIGADYISRIQRINGLDRVLEIVEETKERYEQATRT